MGSCKHGSYIFYSPIICTGGDKGYVCYNPRTKKSYIESYKININKFICTTKNEYEKLYIDVLNASRLLDECRLESRF